MNQRRRDNYFFRVQLVNYINAGCLMRNNKILHLLHASLPIKLSAPKITGEFTAAPDIAKENGFIDDTIAVERYNGNNRYVLQMTDYLNKYLYDDLFGVYVHGSLGTYEEISYSDFDALVIIRNEVLENHKRLSYVAKKLYDARKIMHKMDPLQHHGWFVLTESDLIDYPQTYFPWEIFKYARSLLPDKGLNIKLSFDHGKQDYKTPFLELALGIRFQLENNGYPGNMYQLKGLLSRFMLLPALYCQARDRKGVFKKFSFDAARKDFLASDWAIMDEVSDIRSNWHFLLGPVRRYIMTRRSPLWLRFKRKVGPRIPPGLKSKLTAGFYQRIFDLIEQMEKKLQ